MSHLCALSISILALVMIKLPKQSHVYDIGLDAQSHWSRILVCTMYTL